MAELNLAHYEDVLGQLPRLKTYSHLLLVFPLLGDRCPDPLIDSIESAAQEVRNAFPWLACRVLHEGRGPGNSGVFKLATCPEFAFPNPVVRRKDCTDNFPTYQEIIDAHGPVAMLDGNILAPLPAFPHIYDDSKLNPAPVLAIQVTVIKGGLLLDIAAQHNIVDGGSLMRILDLLAKSMRGEQFSAEEIEHGNRDRTKLIRLLQSDEPMLDHSHLILDPHGASKPPGGRPKAQWRYVRFPVQKRNILKERANKEIEGGDELFISTNDTLSAFIWKRVSAARLKRRKRPDDLSKFSRALDARRALEIPREYLGQMGYNATCFLTFRELETMSVGQIGVFLRQAVREVNTNYAARSWATLIANEPNKARIMFGGSFNPDKDIGISSILHANFNNVDFGDLGKPSLFRRPLFSPLESCVYLWTQTVEGHVDALLCLIEADWNELRADVEWSEHTELIG
ncbi:hypothetical protein N7533_003245 [Penicillium manginii]|uniref:uncharacterized protein n=1 Tax=Penicillium manginii TaxID=203109 RepID=UPI00254853A3|nr:uncharacterized protein N7533_003245 [Penicillium manginii]KAJ5764564.1 hypothetical protein N7533_003245 [Penicillium manginii]